MTSVADDAPIFVVGTARSGTTLMRLLLSAHPRIYICHELSFYEWASFHPKHLDGTSFLKDYFRTHNFKGLRLESAMVMENLPQRLEKPEVGLALRQIMRLKAHSVSRARYGDKSPDNIGHLRRIYADFPNARVVVMARDPRTNIPSMQRRHFASSSDLANCLTYVRARRRIWRFRDRVHIVRLEDLQRDPRKVMSEVLEFVGEEWSEDVLNHAQNRADPLDVPDEEWFARAVTPIERQAHQRPTIPSERVRLIETMTRDSMRELGYEKLDLPSGPSAARTALRILAEVPETLRFWFVVARLLRWLRDPAHWDPENPRLAVLIRGINPKASYSRLPPTIRSRPRSVSR